MKQSHRCNHISRYEAARPKDCHRGESCCSLQSTHRVRVQDANGADPASRNPFGNFACLGVLEVFFSSLRSVTVVALCPRFRLQLAFTFSAIVLSRRILLFGLLTIEVCEAHSCYSQIIALCRKDLSGSYTMNKTIEKQLCLWRYSV